MLKYKIPQIVTLTHFNVNCTNEKRPVVSTTGLQFEYPFRMSGIYTWSGSLTTCLVVRNATNMYLP